MPSSPASDIHDMERLRKLMPFTTAAVIVAALYVGWVLYSRHAAVKEAERKAEAARVEEAKRTLEMMGSGAVKILSFNISPPVVRRGQSAQLCYGVSNAKTVEITPAVGDVWPSQSHCVDISPKEDTEYVFTAKDEAGHSESAKAKVLIAK